MTDFIGIDSISLKHMHKFQKIHRWWLKPQCDISLWPGTLHFSQHSIKQLVLLKLWIPNEFSEITWATLDLGIFNDAFSQIFEYTVLSLEERGIKYSFIDKKEVKYVIENACPRYEASDNRYAQQRVHESAFRDSKINVLFNLPIEQMLTHDKETIRFYAVQRIEAQEKLKHVPQQSPHQTRSHQQLLGQKAR